MRTGQNPFKDAEKPIERPASITVGVLNFIPEQSGYFRGQLDSLKLCLASLRAHASQPFELLVVDNGSCNEVCTYLKDELEAGRIDTLISNHHNLGKMNAQMQILHGASGELVFYSDGDIYYHPGWMQAHLDVLAAFPEAGLVGGVPLRMLAEFHTAGTRAWAEGHPAEVELERGNLIPEEWSREFFHSAGTKYDAQEWAGLEDWRVTRAGVAAFVGATHMQFLIPRTVIERIPRRRFEFALEPAEDAHLDNSIEAAGLLRLSVAQPVVYHIGNQITEGWLLEEYARLLGSSIKPSPAPEEKSGRKRHWFWGSSRVRRFLRWLSDWSFETAWKYFR